MNRLRIVSGILLLNVFLPKTSLASYEQHQWRYLSGFDLITTISKSFPGYSFTKSAQLPKTCSTIRVSNKDALGVDTPVLGKPILATPNPALIRWLNQCVGAYLDYEFPKAGDFREGLVQDYFPVPIIESHQLADSTKLREFLFKVKWANISSAEQKQIVTRSVQRLIGPPEVLAATPYNGSMDNLVSDLLAIVNRQAKPDEYLVTAMNDLLFSIVTRDEFLGY